jgi:hypothetical protein
MSDQAWVWALRFLIVLGLLIVLGWLLHSDETAALFITLGVFWMAQSLIAGLIPHTWERISGSRSSFTALGGLVAGTIFISAGVLWHASRSWLVIIGGTFPLTLVLVAWEDRHARRARSQRRGGGG